MQSLFRTVQKQSLTHGLTVSKKTKKRRIKHKYKETQLNRKLANRQTKNKQTDKKIKKVMGSRQT